MSVRKLFVAVKSESSRVVVRFEVLPPRLGWPRVLKRFAAEAWRRADAGELADNELYCTDAAWSGLYDRTHLRFYTRKSIQKLLEYCNFEIIEIRGTPSIVQSFAPLLRRRFERDVKAGNHLALSSSTAFQFYQRAIEPAEEGFCNLWPSLLAFQIVLVARRAR